MCALWLDVVGRPEAFRGRIIALVEERVGHQHIQPIAND
jgi:hypothetical protein